MRYIEVKKLIIGIIAIIGLVIVAIYVMQDNVEIHAEPIIHGIGDTLKNSEKSKGKNNNEISLNEYTVNLDFNPMSLKMEGLSNIHYYNNTGKELNRIYIHTYLNQYREEEIKLAFSKELSEKLKGNNMKSGWMDVDSVLINNEKVPFIKEKLGLWVILKESLKAEDSIDMVVSFKGKFPQIDEKIGANEKAIWASHFLPTLSVYNEESFEVQQDSISAHPFLTEISNYNITITTPKEYTVIGTGTEKENIEGDKKVTKISANMVRDFSMGISRYYKKEAKETENGVKINIYTYSEDAEVERAAFYSLESLNYYTRIVGPYPYNEIDLIESSVDLDSISSPGMIMLREETFKNKELLNFSIIYSMGNQWFYNVVQGDFIENPWINEALIFYLQLGNFHSPKGISNFMKDENNKLQKELQSVYDPKLFYPISHYTKQEVYYLVVQRKGRAMIYALHNEIGDNNFQKFLQQYYRRYAYKIVSQEEFILLAEEISGIKLNEFFESWLNDVTIPQSQ